MRFLTLYLLLLLPSIATAQEHPAFAVLRFTSHGGSGTVVKTMEGKTWILSCAHMFEKGADKKPIYTDGYRQDKAKAGPSAHRLLGLDFNMDLSLVEVDNGPMYCIPIAPEGFTPGSHIGSYGYDEMKWPITAKRATIINTTGQVTWTREKPWHGRSGGGLIDLESKVLVGVVQGYEVGGAGRGMYISHATILKFMARFQWQGVARGPPIITESRGGCQCPDCRCPNCPCPRVLPKQTPEPPLFKPLPSKVQPCPPGKR